MVFILDKISKIEMLFFFQMSLEQALLLDS